MGLVAGVRRGWSIQVPNPLSSDFDLEPDRPGGQWHSWALLTALVVLVGTQ